MADAVNMTTSYTTVAKTSEEDELRDAIHGYVNAGWIIDAVQDILVGATASTQVVAHTFRGAATDPNGSGNETS